MSTVSFIVFFITCSFLVNIQVLFAKNSSESISHNESSNENGPLILTPYLQRDKIEDAKLMSEVHLPYFEKVKSYSGYFTVNPKYNSNLFFWFFPSVQNYENAPLVLWLQGGPGDSSMLSVFWETGPFKLVQNNTRLELRNYTWIDTHSMLYIDSPVGTGFSFTNGGYVTNMTQVGEEIYTALKQFFSLFPELKNNDFYVVGESYGGKYVPSVGRIIHLENSKNNDFKINLKGLAIGNGFSDPINYLKLNEILYQVGLIDEVGKLEMSLAENEVKKTLEEKDYGRAFDLFDTLINGALTRYPTLFTNLTGFTNYYDFTQRYDSYSKMLYNVSLFINHTNFGRYLHTGNTNFVGMSAVVLRHLHEEFMQSISPWIAELLNDYRILLYTGQFDIICGYTLVQNYLNHLNFSGAAEYKTVQRQKWLVENELAGYVKQAGNLTDLLVRNAGHMVPFYQPKWSYNMINTFTRQKSFY